MKTYLIAWTTLFMTTAAVAAGRGASGFSRAGAGRAFGSPRSSAAPAHFSTIRSLSLRPIAARRLGNTSSFSGRMAFGRDSSRSLGAGAPVGGGGSFVGTSMNTLVESPGDARSLAYQGGAIAFNPTPQQYLTDAPGAFKGPADLPPGGNVSGGASGRTAITPNGPLTP